MTFKKSKSAKVSYNEQGLIYFVCKTYKKQPNEIRHKILNACTKVGGQYYKALFEFMTEDKSDTQIIIKHYISRSTLYRIRKKFLEEFKLY